MKVIYLGVELENPTKEQEIFPKNLNLGFTVTIKYADNGNYRGIIVIHNNVTEIHINYKTVGNPRVAIETDIHSTGGTREINDVDTLTIVDATEIATEYQMTKN